MNKLMLLLICLFIVSCSNVPQKIEVVELDRIDTCVPPPEPQKIILDTVEFGVMIERESALITITPQDYKKLAKNVGTILKNIEQKNALLEYYRQGCR